MRTFPPFRIATAVTAAVACAWTPLALANRTPQRVSAVRVVGLAPSRSAIHGEPKNEPPFTARFSADPGLAVALHEIATGNYPTLGKPSRVRPAAQATSQRIVVDQAAGFSWTDASLGAAASLDRSYPLPSG
jgi:hypothetical protein